MQIRFVDTIPQAGDIKDGHLYLSLKYNITMHRCPSGCGQLVPLPLSPADWSLSYDGETVSLSPSVGNGILACHSHYFIQNSNIVWATDMSVGQTRQQQVADTEALKRHANSSKPRQSPFMRVLRKILGLNHH